MTHRNDYVFVPQVTYTYDEFGKPDLHQATPTAFAAADDR
jgi:hypothetical protein